MIAEGPHNFGLALHRHGHFGGKNSR